MAFTEFQYRQMLTRLEGSRQRSPLTDADPVEIESDLHYKIIEWCNDRRPRVKYIHARMDRKSTINVGAPDFVLFFSPDCTLLLECKARDYKRTSAQLEYAAELRQRGIEVYEVRSMEDFLKVVSETTKGKV